MADDISPDKIIEDLGGCGRYQVRLSVSVHIIKTIVCFSFTSMIILSARSPWTCADDVMCTNNMTSSVISHGNATVGLPQCPEKACQLFNSTRSCQEYNFLSTTRTFVTEFGLVCGADYIPSMVMSIQVGGTLVGNLVAGQLGDLVGRKPPFFASIVILLASNVLGFLSSSWAMFAVARFFVGLGGGFFLSTQYSLLSEFSLAKWRVWNIGFPSWPLQACLLAFLCWLIKDWRYIQLMIAILCVPFLFSWWLIPESFRWYIANDYPDKARVVLEDVAKTNRKSMDMIGQHMTEKSPDAPTKRHTFLDLFKSKSLIKILALSSVNWAALGLVAYGISFGVQALSGSIYFNLFLFNLVGVPSKATALWLQNRFGRRSTAMMCHVTVAIGGFTVGVVQTIDHPNKDALTNGFALLAFIGITTAWGPIQTMTIELFPTVVRNIGFGFLSVFGRVAAMIGPQLVYADLYMPGILYYTCGVVSSICIVACFFLPETKDRDLNDKIGQGKDKVKPMIPV